MTSKIKRDFGISSKDGETRVDFTKEIDKWCAINKVKREDFIRWMAIARSNSSVIAKFAPHCLRTTDVTATLVIREEVSPKTAYAFGESFWTWYIARIEDFIINMKLMLAMGKDMKLL